VWEREKDGDVGALMYERERERKNNKMKNRVSDSMK
jgi:hypothetical protein